MSTTAASQVNDDSIANRQARRVREALDAEHRSGLKLAMWVRFAILAAALTYLLRFEWTAWQFVNFGLMAAVGTLGWLRFHLAGRGVWSVFASIVIPLLDAGMIAAVTTLPPLLVTPDAVNLIEINRPFGWLALLVVLGAVFYRPLEAAWVGLSAGLAWLAAFYIVLEITGATPLYNPPTGGATLSAFLTLAQSPQFIYGEAWIREALILTIMGVALAVAASRFRQLIRRTVGAERARANLSRYFSPTMVDILSAADRPLGAPREQTAAIVFVDIVGFTRLAEAMPPGDVILMLRDFHKRVADQVFGHAGTLDKYIGDAAMATFGTPQAGPDDAARALSCVCALADAIDEWNKERARAGRPPIEVGIGAHYGPVVVGDIGDERRLEFAVLGDTVNVAARLERLTRTLGVRMVISGALADAATVQRHHAGDLLAGFERLDDQSLRGRHAPIPVLVRPATPHLDNVTPLRAI